MSRIFIFEACEKRRLDLLRLYGRQGWEVDAPNALTDEVFRLGAAAVDVVLVAFEPSDSDAIKDIIRILENLHSEPISSKINTVYISL